MSDRIAFLQNNLPEILDAVRSDANLVSNLAGNRVYCGKCCWAYVLRFVYWCASWLNNPNFSSQKQNLVDALKRTKEAYESQCTEIKDAVNAYQAYLQEALAGPPSPSSSRMSAPKMSWLEATDKIMAWLDVNEMLLDSCKNSQFKKQLTNIGFQFPPQEIDPELIARIQGFRDMVYLEGLTERELPLAILNKLQDRRLFLDRPDANKLDTWVDRVNELGSEMSIIRYLHKGLKAVVVAGNTRSSSSLFKRHVDPGPNTARLEYNLVYRDGKRLNSSIFDQPDDEVIQGRQNWLPTKPIPLPPNEDIRPEEGDAFILEEEYLRRDIDSGGTRVFKLNDKRLVAWFHPNEAVGPMMNVEPLLRSCCGIDYVQPEETYSNGLISLMPRLEDVREYKWDQGTNFRRDRLTFGLINLIQDFMRINKMPFPFTYNSIMFNSHSSRLTAIKSMTESDFDFNALEDFVHVCTKERLDIFQYIMSESGLLKYPNSTKPSISQAYYALFVEGMKGPSINIIQQLSQLGGITDPKLIRRASEIFTAMLALREDIMFELKRQESTNPTVDEIGRQIVECHKMMGAVGVFFSDKIKEKILAMNVPIPTTR